MYSYLIVICYQYARIFTGYYGIVRQRKTDLCIMIKPDTPMIRAVHHGTTLNVVIMFESTTTNNIPEIIRIKSTIYFWSW